MPIPRKIKPWRGFPSVNAVHGIRVRVNRESTINAGRGEVGLSVIGAAGSRHIGTIPAGAFLVGITQKVQTSLGGSATIAFGTTAGGAEVSAAAAVTTQGTSERTLVAGLAMPTVDTALYITLAVDGTANTGIVDFLVRFYVNKD